MIKEQKHTPGLRQRIEKDIANILCIYPTVDFYDEPRQRLVGRLVNTFSAVNDDMLETLKGVQALVVARDCTTETACCGCCRVLGDTIAKAKGGG